MYIYHLEQHTVREEIHQNANSSYLWMLKIQVIYFSLFLVFFLNILMFLQKSCTAFTIRTKYFKILARISM